MVTGIIRAVAETKLAVFGLAACIRFPYGGYGEDHDDRADLVRTATARTADALGHPVDTADVLLIGDTPADSAAAQAAGVAVLGVATGRSTRDDLAKAGATETVPDLQHLDVLRRILA